MRRAFGREHTYSAADLDRFSAGVSTMLENTAPVPASRVSEEQDGIPRTRKPVVPVLHRPMFTGWARYAVASVIIGAVTLVAGKQIWQEYVKGSVPVPMLTYTTANGQRARVTLPDGSTALLNVASRLDVPADYTRGNHTLHLRGEALFDVTHHSRTPFRVIAGSDTTRVLGTSFIVRRYETDTAVTVAVRNGKVAVHSTVVSANQQVKVGDAGHVQLRPASSAQFTFAQGVLTIEDMPLSEAVLELSRWYDADIRLGDPVLGTQRIKGVFAPESLNELAPILDWTFNVRVVRSGRTLTLYPRG
jgi:transmembrane sensor